MQYRTDRYGNPISILGFGCMRFPQTLGIPQTEEIEKEIMTAYRAGVNYFDTAYIYPGSESALGEVLAGNGIREKVHIATKLPHYLVRKPEDMDRIFMEELKRLRTDYIDYYLLHMLSDIRSWNRLLEMGFAAWLDEKMRSGAIRQIGFSYHGNTDMFRQLIDAYDWDFCMIQYNYMDEHTQAGRTGLQYAHSKGLPVFIMEPLRGGRLVSRLPEKAKKIFAEYPTKHTPAGWAFRWLWNQPEVTCVLSGMNSSAMVQENLETAAEAGVGDLGPAEEAMLQEVVSAIQSGMKVGCTGCGYCMPCPKHVDIPGTFAAYNRRYSEGKFWSSVDYMICTVLRKDPTSASNCIGCGKCESHCPQQIAIRTELQNACRELEGPLYRGLRRVVARLKLFG